MSNSVKVGMLVLSGALAVGVLLNAQDRSARGMRRDRGPGGEARMLAMLGSPRGKAELGLTDEQSTRLRQIAVDTRKENIKLRADLQVRRMELGELLRGENPDREAVMQKVLQISNTQGQILRQSVSALLNAKSVLTPEQQKKVQAFMAERRFGRGMRGPRQPGMRGGPDTRPMPKPQPPEPPAN